MDGLGLPGIGLEVPALVDQVSHRLVLAISLLWLPQSTQSTFLVGTFQTWVLLIMG